MTDVQKWLGAMVRCKSPRQGVFKVAGVQTNQYTGKVTAVRLKDTDGSFYTEIRNVTLHKDDCE